MRSRPSDVLTDLEFKIGVCRQCGRYGQIGRTSLRCELPAPPLFADKEFFKRTRYCQRVKEKRDNYSAR